MQMKTIGNWLDRPITWRTSLKASGIVTAIYLVVVAVYYAVYFWDEIMNKLDSLTNLVKSKLNRG